MCVLAQHRPLTADAVRPHLVVVFAPARRFDPCLCQTREPVLIQALVSECAVEALNVGVLRRATRLGQDVFDLSLLRPRQKRFRCELGTVVRSHRPRITAKQRRLVEQPCDVARAHTEVHRHLHALVREIIGHR
jgi:hypothetical protein